MHRPLFSFSSILILFCLCFLGCEIATIEEPFGELWSWKETKALEGHWLNPDSQPMEVAVVTKGNIRMGHLSWDADKKKFVATTGRVQLRRLGKMDFAFFESEQPPRRYMFARIQVREDGSVYWKWPDEKQVMDAVRNSKLAGSLEKTEFNNSFHPHLTCNAEQMLKWIEEVGEDVVFPKLDDDSPMTFRRVEKLKSKSEAKK